MGPLRVHKPAPGDHPALRGGIGGRLPGSPLRRLSKIRQAIQNGTGEENVHVIAYPSGRYNSLAQVTLLENGFDISFTTEEGTNTLIKGQPQSLLGLHRYNMNQSVSVEQLMEWVSPARG